MGKTCKLWAWILAFCMVVSNLSVSAHASAGNVAISTEDMPQQEETIKETEVDEVETTETFVETVEVETQISNEMTDEFSLMSEEIDGYIGEVVEHTDSEGYTLIDLYIIPDDVGKDNFTAEEIQTILGNYEEKSFDHIYFDIIKNSTNELVVDKDSVNVLIPYLKNSTDEHDNYIIFRYSDENQCNSINWSLTNPNTQAENFSVAIDFSVVNGKAEFVLDSTKILKELALEDLKVMMFYSEDNNDEASIIEGLKSLWGEEYTNLKIDGDYVSASYSPGEFYTGVSIYGLNYLENNKTYTLMDEDIYFGYVSEYEDSTGYMVSNLLFDPKQADKTSFTAEELEAMLVYHEGKTYDKIILDYVTDNPRGSQTISKDVFNLLVPYLKASTAERSSNISFMYGTFAGGGTGEIQWNFWSPGTLSSDFTITPNLTVGADGVSFSYETSTGLDSFNADNIQLYMNYIEAYSDDADEVAALNGLWGERPIRLYIGDTDVYSMLLIPNYGGATVYINDLASLPADTTYELSDTALEGELAYTGTVETTGGGFSYLHIEASAMEEAGMEFTEANLLAILAARAENTEERFDSIKFYYGESCETIYASVWNAAIPLLSKASSYFEYSIPAGTEGNWEKWRFYGPTVAEENIDISNEWSINGEGEGVDITFSSLSFPCSSNIFFSLCIPSGTENYEAFYSAMAEGEQGCIYNSSGKWEYAAYAEVWDQEIYMQVNNLTADETYTVNRKEYTGRISVSEDGEWYLDIARDVTTEQLVSILKANADFKFNMITLKDLETVDGKTTLNGAVVNAAAEILFEASESERSILRIYPTAYRRAFNIFNPKGGEEEIDQTLSAEWKVENGKLLLKADVPDYNADQITMDHYLDPESDLAKEIVELWGNEYKTIYINNTSAEGMYYITPWDVYVGFYKVDTLNSEIWYTVEEQQNESETKHVHKWDYAYETTYTEKDTIVATCQNKESECPVENATCKMTLKAPENLIYDGKEKVAEVEGSIAGIETSDIEYDGNHTDAGTYTATVTLNDNGTKYPVSTTFEIKPVEISILVNDAVKKYGQENPQFTFTVTEGALVGEDTAEDLGITFETIATQWAQVSTEGYPVTAKASNKNYNVKVIPGKLVVEKADAIINIDNEKTTYTKVFGDDDFTLEGITTNSDSAFSYEVVSGNNITTGEEKDADEIISVSADGVVTIEGSGIARIAVSVAETANCKAATSDQLITVQVNKAGEEEQSFFVKDIGTYTFTGSAIKPEPRVYDAASEIRLVKGTDYTVSYKNNKKAYTLTEKDAGFDAKKAPSVTIKGKGNYNSSVTVYFTIQPKDISDPADTSITSAEIVLEGNEKVQKKVPTIIYNKKKLSGVAKPADGQALKKTKDFIYSYPELDAEATKDKAFKDNGTWTIVVEGTGNYTGSREVYLTITSKGTSLAKAKIKSIPKQFYDGVSPVELDETELVVTSKVGGQNITLEKDVHYTVSYANNNAVGKASVTITAIKGSGYAGSKTASFTIMGTSIAKAKVEGIENRIYNGQQQKQTVKVTLTTKAGKGKDAVTTQTTLAEGKDYTVTYSKNTNAGTASMVIIGTGIYTGKIRKTFKILPYDMTGETNAEGKVKEGSLLTEAGGLFAKKDGELKVKFAKGGSTPAMTLLFNGKVLTAGKDYAVKYTNNKAVTTAETKKMPLITITGKGNLKGKVTKTFAITGKSLTDAESAVSMSVADKAVSSKAGGYISKPVLTDADGKVLKQGKDYTAPVYTTTDVSGQTITLDKTSKVEAGKTITVTVEGIGAYAGAGSMLSASYRITDKNFGSIKCKKIEKTYTGREVTLTESDFLNEDGTGKITFKDKSGTTELKYGVDFEIVEGSYKKNIKKGTASVTLKGLGAYGGTKTVTFKIKAKGLFL